MDDGVAGPSKGWRCRQPGRNALGVPGQYQAVRRNDLQAGRMDDLAHDFGGPEPDPSARIRVKYNPQRPMTIEVPTRHRPGHGDSQVRENQGFRGRRAKATRICAFFCRIFCLNGKAAYVRLGIFDLRSHLIWQFGHGCTVVVGVCSRSEEIVRARFRRHIDSCC